jgi:PAS domain S-box-containing protein
MFAAVHFFGQRVRYELPREKLTGVTMLGEQAHPDELTLGPEAVSLLEEASALNRIGQLIAGELDLHKVVQAVTDAATQLTGAEFGAFFYNVIDAQGASYMLYTLSGVEPSHFASYPMPRATELFGPTFRGEGVIRLDDVKQDPRFGNNPPHNGMPAGHLPVTSYLAVPVIARSGEVLGGLFFGHSEPGVFTRGHERILVSFAAQAAVAMDNARLFEAAERSRRELAANNEQISNILESISDAFVTLDRDWRYTFVNERAAEFRGTSRADMLGRRIWERFPELGATNLYQALNRAMAAGEAAHFEEFLDAHGSWTETHVYPTRDGLAVLSRDITERKRHDEEAWRLAAIVESSEDAIISKALDGTILTWNTGAERVYGYPAGDVVGRSMTLLLPADRPDEESQILHRIARGERVEHFETVRRTKSGHLIDVSLTISPIRDNRGRVIGASHVARDITERREFEAKLKESTKLESLGVLAGGVAHDFNNLLTGILGNASLAGDLLPPSYGQLRAVLREVVSASERAAHLTRQLLAYAGKGRFVIQVLDLSEMVREISQLIRSSIPKNVQMRLNLAEKLPGIAADSAQIQQVIMNMVINAAEAIPEEQMGNVLITTSSQEVDENYLRQIFSADELGAGEYVVLEVHDTGVGMDEGTLSRIFDPFFTTKFTGRGLGLSAVQGIVRGHKGAIRVYSKPGEGTTFKILFPASPDSLPPADGAELTVAGGHRGLVVLVVDDEQTVRRTAKTSLEFHGYSVIVAESGKEALDVFSTLVQEVAVVLLDLSMPGMGGEEVLRQLQLIRPDVKVVLSSGFNEVEVVQRFTGKGLAGFLQKPYTSAALGVAIDRALKAT